MTKQEFKARWESGEDVGGLTWQDIEYCGLCWGIYNTLTCVTSEELRYAVLVAAETTDAELYNPEDL